MDLYPFPIISYVKRFTGLYDNIPRGIIIADLSEDNIYRYMSTPQKLNGQETFLLDDHGMIISHPQKNRIGTLFQSPELIHLINMSNEGTETIKLNKTQFLATFVKLERQPREEEAAHCSCSDPRPPFDRSHGLMPGRVGPHDA